MQAPGGQQVGEGGVGFHAGKPGLAPGAAHVVQAVIFGLLEQVEVVIQNGVDVELAVNDPARGAVVLEGVPDIAEGVEHLHGAFRGIVDGNGGLHEEIPIGYEGLEFFGGGDAQILLGQGSAIEQRAGGGLPGRGLLLSVAAVGTDLHHGGDALGEVFGGEAKITQGSGGVAVDIVLHESGFQREHVRRFAAGRGGRDDGVKLVAVFAAVRGIEGVGDFHFGVGGHVVLVNHSAQLIGERPDVQRDFFFRRGEAEY